jgi:hypothetical protein
MGYQARRNLVKHENDVLHAYSHNILNQWKNCFSQLLNVRVYIVINGRQIQINRAELDTRSFGVKIAIAKLKNYKSPGSNQIPAELIHARDETLLSEIHELNYSIWNKEELTDQWKEFIIVQI